MYFATGWKNIGLKLKRSLIKIAKPKIKILLISILAQGDTISGKNRRKFFHQFLQILNSSLNSSQRGQLRFSRGNLAKSDKTQRSS